MRDACGAGDKQDVRLVSEQPSQPELGCFDPHPGGNFDDLRLIRDLWPFRKIGAPEREEGHPRDLLVDAYIEHVFILPADKVVGVLNTYDAGRNCSLEPIDI